MKKKKFEVTELCLTDMGPSQETSELVADSVAVDGSSLVFTETYSISTFKEQVPIAIFPAQFTKVRFLGYV